MPCIPLLKHNRSCVLTKLGEHEAEIILPEDGENPRTISLDQLQADFAGHVLFARPAPKLERRTESEHFFHEKRWVWGVLSHYLPIYKHVIVASVIINIIGTEDVRLATSGTLPVPADPLGILSGLLNGLTYSATTLNGLYGTFTLNANGSYTYTLNNNLGAVQGLTTGETLLDVLPYKVTNILGAALNGSYAVTIHGTNDAPTMSLAAAAFARTDLTLTGVLPPPHDPDAHDTASYQPLTAQAGLYGTLTLNADGTYTYVLNSTLDTVRELGRRGKPAGRLLLHGHRQPRGHRRGGLHHHHQRQQRRAHGRRRHRLGHGRRFRGSGSGDGHPAAPRRPEHP